MSNEALTFRQREALSDVACHLDEIGRIIMRMRDDAKSSGPLSQSSIDHYAAQVVEEAGKAEEMLEDMGVPLVRLEEPDHE